MHCSVRWLVTLPHSLMNDLKHCFCWKIPSGLLHVHMNAQRCEVSSVSLTPQLPTSPIFPCIISPFHKPHFQRELLHSISRQTHSHSTSQANEAPSHNLVSVQNSFRQPFSSLQTRTCIHAGLTQASGQGLLHKLVTKTETCRGRYLPAKGVCDPPKPSMG